MTPLHRAGSDILFQSFIVHFGYCLDEVLASFSNLSGLTFVKFNGFISLAGGISEQVLPGFHDIENPCERIFLSDWQLHQGRPRSQFLANCHNCLLKIRTNTVVFVDVNDARNMVLVRLTPDRFRLSLYPLDTRQDNYTTVKHSESAFHFCREVHVAGRINDVNLETLPEGCDNGRLDRNAAFTLLRQKIRGRIPIIDVAKLVRGSRVIENPFRGRRLPGIDVSNNPDVSYVVQIVLIKHAVPLPFDSVPTLPAIVRVRLVRLCHAVDIRLLLEGGASLGNRVNHLICYLLDHRLASAFLRGVDDPFHAQVDGPIHDTLCLDLLALLEDLVDEVVQQLAVVDGISLSWLAELPLLPRHYLPPFFAAVPFLARLAPYFERAFIRLATPAVSSVPRMI